MKHRITTEPNGQNPAVWRSTIALEHTDLRDSVEGPEVTGGEEAARAAVFAWVATALEWLDGTGPGTLSPELLSVVRSLLRLQIAAVPGLAAEERNRLPESGRRSGARSATRSPGWGGWRTTWRR